MRKIEFRGKSRFTGEWEYGSIADEICGGYPQILNGIYLDDGAELTFHHSAVEPDTVGEFSGRYDEKGIPVFEGDIVKVKDLRAKPDEYDKFVGVVDFDSSSFCIQDRFMTHYRWMDYEITVIGNKFDNPELMEQIED